MLHLLVAHPTSVTFTCGPQPPEPPSPLLDPALVNHLNAASVAQHAALQATSHRCEDVLAFTSWVSHNGVITCHAHTTHWCSAIPARAAWADLTPPQRTPFINAAHQGILDPTLSPRTAINLAIRTSNGTLLGGLRADDLSGGGTVTTCGEVVTPDDLTGNTGDFVRVAHRALAEEVGLIAPARITHLGWYFDDVMAQCVLLSIADVDLTPDEVLHCWQTAPDRLENQHLALLDPRHTQSTYLNALFEALAAPPLD